jgi:hypothetical protein
MSNNVSDHMLIIQTKALELEREIISTLSDTDDPFIIKRSKDSLSLAKNIQSNAKYLYQYIEEKE